MKRILAPALLTVGLLTAACGGGGSGGSSTYQKQPNNQAPIQAQPAPTQSPAQSTTSINNKNDSGQNGNAGTNGGYVPRARQTQPATPPAKTGGYVPGARQQPTATPTPAARPSSGGYIPGRRNGGQ